MVLLYHVFFLNDTATTEIYTYRHTLSLHAALPIYSPRRHEVECRPRNRYHSVVDIYAHSGLAAAYVEHWISRAPLNNRMLDGRSEEHTSELQSLMRISYSVSYLKTTHPDHRGLEQHDDPPGIAKQASGHVER